MVVHLIQCSEPWKVNNGRAFSILLDHKRESAFHVLISLTLSIDTSARSRLQWLNNTTYLYWKRQGKKPTRWSDENTVLTIEHIHSRRQSKCEGHPPNGESNYFLLKGSWLQTRIYYRYSERRTTYINENYILLNENNRGEFEGHRTIFGTFTEKHINSPFICSR